MQFRVPQFIDMEDKIIGPLTLKQFGYIIGAGGFTFVIWSLIPIKIIAILLIVPVAGLFLALAFLKINNRPFGEILENAFTYYTSSKVYTWKQPGEAEAKAQQAKLASATAEKLLADTAKAQADTKANQNTLHDLSLGLDVLDRPNNIAQNPVQNIPALQNIGQVPQTVPQSTQEAVVLDNQTSPQNAPDVSPHQPVTLGIRK